VPDCRQDSRSLALIVRSLRADPVRSYQPTRCVVSAIGAAQRHPASFEVQQRVVAVESTGDLANSGNGAVDESLPVMWVTIRRVGP